MAELYRLIIGILKQAKNDYITALKKNDFYKKNELEEFFLSDYGEALSRGHGEIIIHRCQRIVRNQKKKERKK